MRRSPLVVLVLLAACKPDLGSPPSLVVEPRIIAVRQEPPEVAPGAMVSAEVVAVDAGGRLMPPGDEVAWDLCLAPKPPAENNVVSRQCLGGSGLQPVGKGLTVSVVVPATACALHGPDTPPTKPGEPPLRPRDADVTGGYYQPLSVRLLATGDQAFGLERLRCNLPGVSVEVAQEFARRYTANHNPTIGALTADGAPLGTAPLVVAPGRPVALELSWPPEARERFPVFEVAGRQIVDHLEELTVSWFVTAGALARDRTGRGELEPENTVTNTWTAPPAPTTTHLWLVLRDNRGGVAVAEYTLDVR
jgi:hypothetical protein